MTASKKTRIDPSDLLSPIIVKELRQGMRGRVFQSSFLLLQVAMILVVSGALVATSTTDQDQVEMFSGLFWVIVGAPLLAVIPLMGMGALRSEIRANSLELVYLTHLTPWRIVAGKWAALSLQSILFVFSILPYLVIRYFLGGVDLLNELRILLILLALCLFFTSVTVGFSAHPPLLVRLGIGFCAFISLYIVPFLLFAPMRFSVMAGGSAAIDSNPYVLLAIFGILGLFLMLELGTAKIAPVAASRSLQMRLIGMAALGAASILHFAGERSGIAVSAALPLLLFVCLGALVETPPWVQSIYAPYARRGVVARLAGRYFLYPGWPSGIGYTSFVTLAVTLLLTASANISMRDLFPILLVFTSAIFAVAVTRTMRPATPNGFAWFLSVQIVMLLFAVMLSVLYHTEIVRTIPAALAFPPTTLGLLVAWEILPDFARPLYTIITSVVLVLSLLALALRSYSLVPIVRRMEAAAPAEVART
jgi:hypothetical protein